MNARVSQLLDQGQSIWQDDIARSMLTSGKLAATIADVGIRGLTSNPTIFEKAISGGNDYDEQISGLLEAGESPAEIFEAESDDYKASVLGAPGTPRVSVEAGTSIGWQKYADAHVGIDRFGASGPGGKVLEHFGFTVANVVEHARTLLGKERQ